MTREEARDRAKIMLAYADGAGVQFKTSGGDWVETGNPVFNLHDTYRIKPQPKLRAWKPSEVPVGAVMNWVGVWASPSVILCADKDSVSVGGFHTTVPFSFSKLLEREFVYTTDIPVTPQSKWQPCGVMEG